MLFRFFQGCYGCTPSASVAGQGVGLYMRISVKQGMHRPAEIAGAFSMNNTNLENISVNAFFDIARDERSEVFGSEGVQIKCTINRQFLMLVRRVQTTARFLVRFVL